MNLLSTVQLVDSQLTRALPMTVVDQFQSRLAAIAGLPGARGRGVVGASELMSLIMRTELDIWGGSEIHHDDFPATIRSKLAKLRRYDRELCIIHSVLKGVITTDMLKAADLVVMGRFLKPQELVNGKWTGRGEYYVAFSGVPVVLMLSGKLVDEVKTRSPRELTSKRIHKGMIAFIKKRGWGIKERVLLGTQFYLSDDPDGVKRSGAPITTDMSITLDPMTGLEFYVTISAGGALVLHANSPSPEGSVETAKDDLEVLSFIPRYLPYEDDQASGVKEAWLSGRSLDPAYSTSFFEKVQTMPRGQQMSAWRCTTEKFKDWVKESVLACWTAKFSTTYSMETYRAEVLDPEPRAYTEPRAYASEALMNLVMNEGNVFLTVQSEWDDDDETEDDHGRTVLDMVLSSSFLLPQEQENTANLLGAVFREHPLWQRAIKDWVAEVGHEKVRMAMAGEEIQTDNRGLLCFRNLVFEQLPDNVKEKITKKSKFKRVEQQYDDTDLM